MARERDTRRNHETERRPARPHGGGGSTDEQVVALREQGRTYAAIARELGIRRAAGAQASFVRVLRNRSSQDRTPMLQRELGRLDLLEGRIRDRDAADPERLGRRLEALSVLRQTMQDAGGALGKADLAVNRRPSSGD